MSRNFNFPYTCPRINSASNDIEHIVDTFIYEMLREQCANSSEDDIVVIAAEYTKQLLKQLSPIIEEVRQSNQDIRDAAENEISLLLNELDQIKHANT